MNISGSSFTLRPWLATDAEELATHANNRNVWLNLQARFPRPYTAENAARWIRSLERASRRTVQFAIVVDGKAAGGVGIDMSSGREGPVGELGYWLGEDYWQRGICSEAVGLVTDFALREMKIRGLRAVVRDTNHASARVLEKAGFEVQSRLRKGGRRPSTMVVELIYGIRAEAACPPVSHEGTAPAPVIVSLPTHAAPPRRRPPVSSRFSSIVIAPPTR